MWFCKKKKVKEFAKQKYKLYYSSQNFEVGRTTIELNFIDGSIFYVTLYGRIDQHVNYGNDEGLYINYRELCEPTVFEPSITKSEIVAGNFLFNLESHEKTYNNDELTITESVINKVKSGRIIRMESYLKEFSVASVVLKDLYD